MSSSRFSVSADERVGTPRSPGRYAIVLVAMVVVAGAVVVVRIQPQAQRWLELRSAFRNLSHPDSYERDCALQLLSDRGENPDPELIELLHHSNNEVRGFAADSLSHRPWTSSVVEALLAAMENRQTGDEVRFPAEIALSRYAAETRGPLTDIDRRTIAVLRQAMTTSNPEVVRVIAPGLAAYLDRDDSLCEPLLAYVDGESHAFYRYRAARQVARRAPLFRDQFVTLLSGAPVSTNPRLQEWSQEDVCELAWARSGVTELLQRQRSEMTDGGETAKIDKAIDWIESMPGQSEPPE